MHSTDLVKAMIGKRRDKSIAIILSVKDKECDPYLTEEASKDLRKAVLDQINDLCDLACDLLDSVASEDLILNETYLKKIDAMHEVLFSGR